MVHGESAKYAKGGHDDKPESVAVLGLGDFENASRQGEGDGCAVILEGVDDSCCKARHFLSSNVHRGGGANDRVGGVGREGYQDKDGATEEDPPCSWAHVTLEKNDGSDGNHSGFDDVERHGDRGAVAFEETVGNPSG